MPKASFARIRKLLNAVVVDGQGDVVYGLSR